MSKTFLQITARDQMRGRVTALCSIGWQGTTALGAPVVGVLGHALGGRYALAFGGICCIAVAVPVLLARARVTAGRSIQTIGTQPYGCAGDDLSTADGAARRADDNPSSG
jgi:MFS family permease